MENKNRRIGISKIALTNFQTFSKREEIPIEKITLLFGPNSVGKSAIGDALDIIRMIRASETMHGKKAITGGYTASAAARQTLVGNIAMENKLFLDALKSCWRKSGTPSRYQQTMVIEVDRNVNVEGAGSIFRRGLEEDGVDVVSISESFTFYICDDNFTGMLEDGRCINLMYKLSIENEEILSFEEAASVARLNCAHKLISPLDFSMYLDEEVDSSEIDSPVSDESSIIEFSGVDGFTLSGGFYRGINLTIDSGGYEAKLRKAFSIFSQKFEMVLSSVWWCHDGWMDPHDKTPGLAMTGVVEASRKVPTKRDMFLCSSSAPSPFLIEAHFNIAPQNNYIECIGDDGVLQRVNYFLSNQLFIDKGYYVGCDSEHIEKIFKVMVDANQLLEEEDGSLTFKQFYLADHAGTRFDFDEVGSGLGYVFPVLCILAQKENSFVIIQQPELHIHPALQAAMGDVIIESAKTLLIGSHYGPENEPCLEIWYPNGKTIVIETHSEHLLLRILKRIRQTHLEVSIEPDLKISADDVCVLYFDPLPDGTTTVKRLRITEDGEFMDRWPRGFFSERDQELSDE